MNIYIQGVRKVSVQYIFEVSEDIKMEIRQLHTQKKSTSSRIYYFLTLAEVGAARCTPKS